MIKIEQCPHIEEHLLVYSEDNTEFLCRVDLKNKSCQFNIAARFLKSTELNSISELTKYGVKYHFDELLSGIVFPKYLSEWWGNHNESFGKAPIDVLKADEYDVLYNMIFQLNTGMPG